MMYLRRLIVFVMCLIALAIPAQAEPLTNFDENSYSIDFGAWKTDTTLNGYKYTGKWPVFAGITAGLGGNWGIQYIYHGINTKPVNTTIVVKDRYVSTQSKITGSTSEFNLLYSFGKNSRFAIFAGVNQVDTKLSGSPAWKGKYSICQGGVIATAPLGDKVDAFALGSVGSHGLSQTEVGIAAKLSNNWQANVSYRWYQLNNAFNNVDGHAVSETGKVKVNGIKFGFTYFFDNKKQEKTEPPVAPTPKQKEEPVQTPVTIENPPEKIILQDVNFDFDKDNLKPQAYPILEKVVDIAKQNSAKSFKLVGHTDSIGSDEYNMDLSWRRVTTVEKYLVGQGVKENRLTTDAKGKREPIATNETSEGRAQNRRVEITIK